MKRIKLGIGYALLSFQIIAAMQTEFGESLFLKNLNQALMMSHNYFETLNTLTNKTLETSKFHTDSNCLFNAYPKLAQRIPYLKLGNLPTPIIFLNKLSKQLNNTIYLKNDGLTNLNPSLFGGNKVRKLEFLLAEALAHGAQSVLTFGAAGSNHVVATACYTKAVGLKCIAMLKKQPNAQVVRRNLLLMQHFNAELHLSPTTEMRSLQTIATFIENKNIQNNFPYFIPTGGSIPVGILGYVNAVFELSQQIKEGLMPEPDYIYVPAGSFGTMVGLLLGIKATQLKTKLKAVLVEPLDNIATQQKIINLFNETNKLLNTADQSFPLFNITNDELNLITNYTGNVYGQFTKEGKEALTKLNELENIRLDGTYTAKAFAALLNDLTHVKNNIILFWYTFCSNNFEALLAKQNYLELPRCFHGYFQQKVQPFDIA